MTRQPETWYTSDMHFGHARIIELSYRPFKDVDEMNDALVNNWNRVVYYNDTVNILGDGCMSQREKTLPIIKHLNGYKKLWLGNHDYPHESNFTSQPQKRAMWEEKYLEVFDEIVHGWTDEVVGGHRVRFCHFPPTGDHTDEERYSEFRPPNDGVPCIHGHVHDSWQVVEAHDGLYINVGVDVWDYTPVNEREIVALLDHYRERS